MEENFPLTEYGLLTALLVVMDFNISLYPTSIQGIRPTGVVKNI